MIEREELPGQLCMFEGTDTEQLRRAHLLSDPEQWTQVYADDMRALADGTEVIVVRQGRDYKSGAYKPELNHYYRAVTWIVPLRYGGHDVRLVSEPTEDWPERPPWLSSGERGQWVLPHWIDMYYVRKEAVEA